MTLSLDELAYELQTITEQEKNLKVRKDDLRRQLFNYGVQDYEGREYLLPTTTITVPDEFWVTTGLGPEDFLERSFPTWDVISVESNQIAMTTVFVLRKKPLYMPFSWDDGSIKVSKTSTEPTPEIDLETLKAERPDVFMAITTLVAKRELDGEKLQEALAEDQEIHSILMRHTKYTREPQQRVGIKDA